MAKADSVSQEEWKQVSKVKTTMDFFIFLTHTYTSKESLPAQKMSNNEFFGKP